MGRHRHALPSGRRELETAYRALVAEAAAQRAETSQARLEVTRLLALTEGLTGLVTRLSGELSEARRALDRRPDEGRAALLVAQVEDLRTTVRQQQDLLAALTRSVADSLAARPDPPTVVVAAAPPVPAPTPAVATQSPTPDVEPSAAPAPPVPSAASAPQVSVPGHVGPAEPVPTDPEPDTGGPVEDETVLRLRLIRQAFEG
jgi:hypothetical protein